MPNPAITLGAGASFDFTFEDGSQSQRGLVHALQTELSEWQSAWAQQSRLTGEWKTYAGALSGELEAAKVTVVAAAPGPQTESAVRAPTLADTHTDAAAHEQGHAQSALAFARRAEQTARRLAQELLVQNKILTAKMESMQTLTGADAHDRGVFLENEVARLQPENDELKAERQKLQENLHKAHQDRALHEAQLVQQTTELQDLAAHVDRLKRDVEQANQGTRNTVAQLDRAYAERQNASQARDAAYRARDDAAARHREIEFRFNHLHAAWRDGRERIEELEGELAAISFLKDENDGLQTEMDTLQDQLADRDHALLVKDERISDLETKYQHELHRNKKAAAARDITGELAELDLSPIDNGAADSLLDELERTSQFGGDADEEEENEDVVIYEEQHLSPIMEIVSIKPVEPRASMHAISLSEVVNAAPVAPTATPLTMHVAEAASVAPVSPEAAPLTAHVSEAVDTAPVEPSTASLTINIGEAVSVAPVSPRATPLAMHVNEAASVAPLRRQSTPFTMHVPQHGTVSTVPLAPAPAPARLSINMIDTATIDVPPVDIEQPTQPRLTINMIDAATIDLPPVNIEQPTQPRLTINTIDPATISLAPIDVDSPAFQHHLAMEMIPSATLSHAPVDVPPPHRNPTRDWTSQTTISNPTLKITPFIVTPDLWPLDEIEPRRPTSDSTAQTDPDPAPPSQETPPTLQVDAAAAAAATPPSKTGLAHWALHLLLTLFMLLTGCFLHLWLRLHAWETANGYGGPSSFFSQGGGSSASTGGSGAFGNGRYFLGVFPLAMGVGNTDLYERFCRFAAVFIAQWEGGAYGRSY